ncbi:H+/gluconate symporter [Dethiosulfatibacter aminovorans DSM 17477]|uniref:H+/gluconate symporter n=1 Tax=Dethiosulfatibacter aminovorans DSM 17477 TaxID=1121476 RepID=A0A1M6JMH9_9FIRM|nr:GntP family permease [Dethiosulfatibacter aminovorans]SHJ47886.1 H+/gluconate symporter [Dethiosulfatibacter aminovorans DSM 17477]
MFDILIIVISLVLFSVLAFRRVSAIILGPLISVFLIVFARLPMFDTMIGPYMTAAGGYVQKFFLVFFVGALFGAIYEETKAAEAIAVALVKVTKGKFAAPVVMIITGLLTYGGVSGFVVFFAMYPIALQLFKSTNVSRRLIPAAISAGAWTWSMSGPGSPAIQNVIPMRYLGTGSLAALIPATAAALGQLIMIFIWLEFRTKNLQKRGFEFHDETLKPIDETVHESSELPNPILSAIPAILILLCFNILKMPVEGAVMIGIITATVFLWNKIRSVDNYIAIINKGAANSATAILNTAIVVGFAGVVRVTDGFGNIIAGLKNLKMSPMWFVAITAAIAAGAAGSASGGLGIAYEALKQTYIDMGVNLEYVHRISVIAAGTLDTLPHQGAQITLLAICGLTHKEGYFDIAITQIIIPFIALGLLCIPLASMGL